jgi:predicted nucleic acid-binding protein
VIFWDTSALVRRYVANEPAAQRVQMATELSAANEHNISRLLPTEMASALALKTRSAAITVAERDGHWRRFQLHLQRQYQMLELTHAVWTSAQELLFRRVLRAGDAIHLAAALATQARPHGRDLVFWTADRRQADAAMAEGLRVELLA